MSDECQTILTMTFNDYSIPIKKSIDFVRPFRNWFGRSVIVLCCGYVLRQQFDVFLSLEDERTLGIVGWNEAIHSQIFLLLILSTYVRSL